MIVGIAIAAYLLIDSSAVQKGVAIGRGGSDASGDLLQQGQFFLLEAGFVGAAILSLWRSAKVALALIVLALLPFVYLGPANDFVMRASIPSLAILAIGAALALTTARESEIARLNTKKIFLVTFLVVGSITPLEEFARAALLPAWPINLQATLIGASCGYAPHYIARLNDQLLVRIMRNPHRLPLGPIGPAECDNPAFDLMRQAVKNTARRIGRLATEGASLC